MWAPHFIWGPSIANQGAVMKMGNRARLLLAAPALGLVAGFAAGCGDFWQAPTGSTSATSCTTNCSTATSGSFYILNSGTTPQIVGESIVSGTLTQLSGSPYPVVGVPYAMAISPTGGFLYVSSTAGIDLYPIGSNGALGTATNISTDQAFAMEVDPSGTWLVDAQQGTGGVQLDAIPITSTGTYESGAPVPTVSFSIAGTAVQPGQLAISSDGANVFVALGTGGTLVVPFDSTTPFPTGTQGTTIQVAHTGGSAVSVAVDPTTRLFYVGEVLGDSAGTAGGLRVFNYSSLGSTLTQVANSPFASGGLAPNFILPIATGDYIYVANGEGTSTGNITGFAITASGTSTAPTFTVATGSTASAGTLPVGLAEDNTGTYLLGVNASGSPFFDSYTFDATTAGLLDPQITANTGTTPFAIVAVP
jgi:hypothetical protein